MTDRNKNINRFEVLYGKYQDNTISEDEMDELLSLSGREEVSQWIEGPLKENWKEIVAQNPMPLSTRSRSYRQRSFLKLWTWSAAASLALLIIASIWYWNRDMGWKEYSTGNGETLEVVLSDESRVLLNANSTIRWNADWKKEDERSIELTGEAFFDIAHMEAVPLEVESKNATIRVLGTSFNVREDVLGIDVYLYEGSIELDFNPDAADSTEILMTSGDRIIKPVNKTELIIYEGVTKSEAASWTEGELRFIDRPLGEILIRLEGIYGKSFVVEDSSMLSIPMDVGVPYANWEVMKSALELSLSVKLEENGQTVKLTEKE